MRGVQGGESGWLMRAVALIGIFNFQLPISMKFRIELISTSCFNRQLAIGN
jgi:hypothetical protein